MKFANFSVLAIGVNIANQIKKKKAEASSSKEEDNTVESSNKNPIIILTGSPSKPITYTLGNEDDRDFALFSLIMMLNWQNSQIPSSDEIHEVFKDVDQDPFDAFQAMIALVKEDAEGDGMSKIPLHKIFDALEEIGEDHLYNVWLSIHENLMGYYELSQKEEDDSFDPDNYTEEEAYDWVIAIFEMIADPENEHYLEGLIAGVEDYEDPHPVSNADQQTEGEEEGEEEEEEEATSKPKRTRKRVKKAPVASSSKSTSTASSSTKREKKESSSDDSRLLPAYTYKNFVEAWKDMRERYSNNFTMAWRGALDTSGKGRSVKNSTIKRIAKDLEDYNKNAPNNVKLMPSKAVKLFVKQMDLYMNDLINGPKEKEKPVVKEDTDGSDKKHPTTSVEARVKVDESTFLPFSLGRMIRYLIAKPDSKLNKAFIESVDAIYLNKASLGATAFSKADIVCDVIDEITD